MPDTAIILDAINKVEGHVTHVHRQVDDLVKGSGVMAADVRECKVKIESIDDRLDKQNGKIAEVEETAQNALSEAENARKLWLKRGTIIAILIGAIGAIGAAAIEAWGGW